MGRCPKSKCVNFILSKFLRSFKFCNIFKKFLISEKTGFDSYKNHIKLFKLICNKVDTGSAQDLFKNLTEVENSIQAFFRSIHQKPRISKLNRQEPEDENWHEEKM